MGEADLYRDAYNAHEGAESAAMVAMRQYLTTQSVDALACLCDPQWRWETRSWLSEAIIEHARDVLDEKLEALIAA